MKTALVNACEKLMNNQRGLELVLENHSVIHTLTLTWNDESFDEDTRQKVIKLLAFLCMIPGGHPQVTKAFSNYKEVKREKVRFEAFI